MFDINLKDSEPYLLFSERYMITLIISTEKSLCPKVMYIYNFAIITFLQYIPSLNPQITGYPSLFYKPLMRQSKTDPVVD